MARRPPRRRGRSLNDVGEFGFLDELLPKVGVDDGSILVGLGDDAAVMRAERGSLVVTTDALVCGIHYRAEWLSERQLGRKAFLVNASDIAAMGARPRWCLASLGVPGETDRDDLLDMMLGLHEAAAENGACIVGGNVARSRDRFISVTLIGIGGASAVSRSGARPGDRILVSGPLGGAAEAVRRMLERPGRPRRSLAVDAWREPPVRTELGRRLAQSRLASAMIDLSDGLMQDLGHLCVASDVGAELDVAAIPVHPGVRGTRKEALATAVRGGEDYELLFTVPARRMREALALARELCGAAAEVGMIVAGSGIRCSDPRWRGILDAAAGHDHFRARSEPAR